jgi:plastocyanin
MTTDTPELDEQEAPPADAAADDAGDAGDAAATAPEPERPRFWDRPYVDRYLVPLILPVLVVGGVVMFILNISRIFLTTHGNVDVVVGTVILLVILIGASLLAAAPRMRTASISLITGGFVASILMLGWLSLGSAEPEGEAGSTLPAEGPFNFELTFESTNALVFNPSQATGETGIAKVTLTNGGGEHTLHFEDGNTLAETLSVQAAGDTATGRAFFGEPGEYVFYCTIPGHREAGMEGDVTIEGDPITLEAAEAAAGGTAEGGAGEGGAPAGGDGGEAPAPEGETPTSTG